MYGVMNVNTRMYFQYLLFVKSEVSMHFVKFELDHDVIIYLLSLHKHRIIYLYFSNKFARKTRYCA